MKIQSECTILNRNLFESQKLPLLTISFFTLPFLVDGREIHWEQEPQTALRTRTFPLVTAKWHCWRWTSSIYLHKASEKTLPSGCSSSVSVIWCSASLIKVLGAACHPRPNYILIPCRTATWWQWWPGLSRQ